MLLTNRLDWTAEQVVAGYAGQQQVERIFRGLKDGEWLAWGPMHHWTDCKIRIHAFYPPWVIPTGRLKLHKKELLGICRPNPQ